MSPDHLLEAQHSLALEEDVIGKQVLSRPVMDYVKRRAALGEGTGEADS
jgi:hypothetical protein